MLPLNNERLFIKSKCKLSVIVVDMKGFVNDEKKGSQKLPVYWHITNETLCKIT